MEIIILWAWSIWTERNGLIFQQQQPSSAHVKEKFKNEFTLVIHRAKLLYKAQMEQWLHTF